VLYRIWPAERSGAQQFLLGDTVALQNNLGREQVSIDLKGHFKLTRLDAIEPQI
jgi:hypothetical protein